MLLSLLASPPSVYIACLVFCPFPWTNVDDVGAFGNVRVGWLKTNKHQKYAVKTMKKAEIIKSKHVDHIENEKNILEKIQHPFVVSICLSGPLRIFP